MSTQIEHDNWLCH